MHLSKKSLELVQWTLIVFLIGIVVFLIFYYFIKAGMFQIGSLSSQALATPGEFAK